MNADGPMDADRLPTLVHDGLAVYRCGEGAPVLLIPGPHRYEQPGMRMADALIAGLVGLGRQVITFDPPGSGHSTRPAQLSMAEMLGCAGEALDACGVTGSVDVLGHSMAGLVALAFALDYPARVRRLVLVGTGTGGRAYTQATGALWNRGHPRFWRMAALGSLQTVWPHRAPEQMFLNFAQRESFYDKSFVRPLPVTLRDWGRPRRGRPDWQAVARRLDYGPRLGEVQSPALVLGGRHDPQYPPSCSEELAAGIPHARLLLFARSGHYPFIEEPDAFWPAVADFLDG